MNSSFPKKALLLQLEKAIQMAGWSCEVGAPAALMDYLELLYRWNSVHNLTSIQNPEEGVALHLLDSLTVLPYLAANTPLRVLDVGTGAGLPGIPLAINRPEQEFVLMDSNQKKINFLQHVIISLKLKNVLAVHARVELYHSSILFDYIISRALSSVSNFVSNSQHLSCQGTQWIAMKGILQTEELAELPLNYEVKQVQAVQIPGLNVKRHLVFVNKK